MIERRQFVTPGELLAEGDHKSGENTYQENNKIYASKTGLANFVRNNVYVVALSGSYIPAVGDLVIGKVVGVRLGVWIIDINSPYVSVLFASEAVSRSFNSRREEMSKYLKIGDVVLAKIISFDRTKDPTLTIREPGLGKITHGHIIEITPTKVPRLIGQRGSMINLIKRETNCQITVGRNGLILINGTKLESEALATKAINMIERDAHTTGLTDRVNKLIQREKKEMQKNAKKEST